jgi:hypothetical protein
MPRCGATTDEGNCSSLFSSSYSAFIEAEQEDDDENDFQGRKRPATTHLALGKTRRNVSFNPDFTIGEEFLLPNGNGLLQGVDNMLTGCEGCFTMG